MPAYVTVTEADTYFTDRDIEGVWSGTVTQKTKVIQIASDQIDSLEYAGEKNSGTTQELQFPRVHHMFATRRSIFWDTDISGTVQVPEDVKSAVFEQARMLLAAQNAGDPIADKLRKGLTSISVGSTSESYGGSSKISLFFDARTGLYREAKKFIEKYLLRAY